MKTLLSLVVIGFAALNVHAYAAEAGNQEAQTEQTAAEQTVILSVPGMSCGMCPITIRAALNKVDGVIEASADNASKTATVRFDPSKTNVEALIEATKNAGYPSSVQEVEETEQATEKAE